MTNKRFYAPDGEGADGQYMEVYENDKLQWCVRCFDAKGRSLWLAWGYESEAYAIRKAHDFRPNWNEKPHVIGTCPECGSADVDDWHGWDVDGRKPFEARLDARCNECGCEFSEVFTYSHVKKGW